VGASDHEAIRQFAKLGARHRGSLATPVVVDDGPRSVLMPIDHRHWTNPSCGAAGARMPDSFKATVSRRV
jgi:hypothetical protein